MGMNRILSTLQTMCVWPRAITKHDAGDHITKCRARRGFSDAPAIRAGEYTALAPYSKEYFAFLCGTPPGRWFWWRWNYSEKQCDLKLKVQGFERARILFSSLARSRSDEKLARLLVGAFQSADRRVEVD